MTVGTTSNFKKYHSLLNAINGIGYHLVIHLQTLDSLLSFEGFTQVHWHSQSEKLEFYTISPELQVGLLILPSLSSTSKATFEDRIVQNKTI